MNHRENLKECFQERLEATMHDVKVIMNQIERMNHNINRFRQA